MRKFAEIKAIMKTENIETDIFNEKMYSTLDNAFIMDCDEFGVTKYENMLNITPIVNDTLESRKSRILLHWNNTLPYSYTCLINKLNTFCGHGNYEIEGDLKNYTLIIKTHLSLPGQVQELENMLDRIIPSNMVVTIENNLHYDLNGTVFMGSVTIHTNYFTIS